jgi:MFS family permease
LSALTYTIWIGSAFIGSHDDVSNGTVEALVVISNILIGFGAGILWVTHGKYLSDFIKSNEEKAGLYSSIFFGFFSSALICSNLFNTLFLGYLGTPNSLLGVNTLISLVPELIFQILPDPPQHGADINESSKRKKIIEMVKDLIKLFGDSRIKSMYGLFFANACSNMLP